MRQRSSGSDGSGSARAVATRRLQRQRPNRAAPAVAAAVESIRNGYGIAIKLILKVVLSIYGNSMPCRRECICCTLDYATGRIIRRN